MSLSCAAIDAAERSALSSAATLQSEFESSPYWSLRHLACNCDEGRIILRGTVTSFYLKQLALAMAAKAVGVGCVQIDIDVRSE
jgi:BON domain-containing protein